MLKAHVKEMEGVRTVNLEAKNCILKLEEEYRKNINKKKSLEKMKKS